MEISLLKAFLSDVSSFLHLSTINNTRPELVQKYYHKPEEILKLLKPILDAIVDTDIDSDETLNEILDEFGQSVDELKGKYKNWQPLSSKLYFALQNESLISKIQSFSLEIFDLLMYSDQCLPDQLSSSSIEYCCQKIKQMGHEQTSSIVREAMRDQEESVEPNLEILEKIADSLGLRSNQEILIEAVALEKLRENAEQRKKTKEVELFDQMISLVTRMQDHIILIKQSETSSPVPIPADFCCPLSLELMTNPVIVSSGQTYEKECIKNWIDLGLTVCPKTRQTLVHTNLIPNYTVKALIANWCESNNVKLPDLVKHVVTIVQICSDMDCNEPVTLNHSRQASGLSPVNENEACANGSMGLSNHVSSYSSGSSGEVKGEPHDSFRLNGPDREPEYSPRLMEPWSRSQTIGRWLSDRIVPRIVSSPVIETRADFSGVESQVRKLVEDLKSNSIDSQRKAAGELRLLAKHNMDNRIVIANSGAIPILVNLLRSTDTKIQENAVTALLNISINDNNKTAIADADAIEPLVHVLKTGSLAAKENAAATLFSLSVIKENKVKIGRSGAIQALVDLLGNGTPRGKKDAATALFNLSIYHENKGQVVFAGAVKYLVELMDPAGGMVDKAVAVLANLATIPEGRAAIGQEGAIPLLVEVVELGSARGKENAVAALLHLCMNSNRFCSIVIQEGAVPPLVALSHSGTPRAKEKAQALIQFFRSQRHSNARG